MTKAVVFSKLLNHCSPEGWWEDCCHWTCVPVTAVVVVMVVVAVVNTLTNVLCTLDRRLLSCIACCNLMAKVQIYEPCEKMSLFQDLCWTKKSKLAKSLK